MFRSYELIEKQNKTLKAKVRRLEKRIEKMETETIDHLKERIDFLSDELTFVDNEFKTLLNISILDPKMTVLETIKRLKCYKEELTIEELQVLIEDNPSLAIKNIIKDDSDSDIEKYFYSDTAE